MCGFSDLVHQTHSSKALVRTDAESTVMSSIPSGISGMIGVSQQLTVLEVEVTLMRNEWQKHSFGTGPDAPCFLGRNHLKRGYG